jgi:hypothetical protein
MIIHQEWAMGASQKILHPIDIPVVAGQSPLE